MVVTGKGGVGKTTVAAALGLLAARRGRRTVVCEVAQQERLAGLFGAHDVGHGEVELAPGLFAVSVQPERAMHEWLRHQLKSGALAGLLGHSRLFGYLTAAAPGVTELVTVGKVWDLAQPKRRTGGSTFDTVIMDAPATGHALALLRAPRTYANIARVGPIARQAAQIDALPARSGRDRRALRGAARGDAGERDRRPRAAARRGAGAARSTRWWPTACCPSASTRARRAACASSRTQGTKAAQAAVAAALVEHRRARGAARAARAPARGGRAPRWRRCPTCSSPSSRRRELELLSDRLEEAL